MDKETLFQTLKLILIVLGVVGVGTFTVNQVFDYYYKTALLSNPCDLCLELNPNLSLTQNYFSQIDPGNLTIIPSPTLSS